MQQGAIRGRPPGQMTLAKRKALAFIVSKQAKGEPIILGEMIRVCGFTNRWNAKRVIKGLRDMGVIN